MLNEFENGTVYETDKRKKKDSFVNHRICKKSEKFNDSNLIFI